MHHENHHFELHKILHDKMNNLYFFQTSMNFVKTLIGIFVPVYMYSLGLSIIQICIYTAIYSMIYLLLTPYSIDLINKIGFKKMLLLSIPMYFFHIISLNYISENHLYIYLASITFGLYIVTFWPTMHAQITLSGDNHKRASQIGTLQVLASIFSAIAPILGGFILEYFGYYSLLLFSLVFLFLGIIPLLLSEDLKLKNYSFAFKDYKRLWNWKNKNDVIAFKSEGIEMFLGIILWPIILYILLKNNFFNLGLLYTILSFLSVVFIVYFKSKLDKINKNIFFKKITKGLSISWFLRILVLLFGNIFLYIVETFYKLIISMFSISYWTIFYNNAKNKNTMDYIILRELHLHSSKIFFMLFIIPFLFFFGENLSTLFLISFFGILAPLGLGYLQES